MTEHVLPPVVRTHLDELTGDLGIWQHATGTAPNHGSGTCTDDVARALMVDLAHARVVGWAAVRASAWRSLRYLRDAWNPTAGLFRNFRDAHGAWLDDGGSEDCQGRALRALGMALHEPREPAFAADAQLLFGVALAAAGRLHAWRGIASSILGCVAALEGDALRGDLREAAESRLRLLADRLQGAFSHHATTPDWPWPEPVVTYENALLPHALIVAGGRLGEPGTSRLGLHVLDWLLVAQRSAEGQFSPVGTGWWRHDGHRSRFDQQPIEAGSTLAACEAAFELTSDRRYLDAMERCLGWFLGDNDARLAVAAPATGGCHDGLGPHEVNANQGAESTLMWLLGVEQLRGARRQASRGVPAMVR